MATYHPGYQSELRKLYTHVFQGLDSGSLVIAVSLWAKSTEEKGKTDNFPDRRIKPKSSVCLDGLQVWEGAWRNVNVSQLGKAETLLGPGSHVIKTTLDKKEIFYIQIVRSYIFNCFTLRRITVNSIYHNVLPVCSYVPGWGFWLIIGTGCPGSSEVTIHGSVQKISWYCTSWYGLVGMVVFSWRLDLNLHDSMTLSPSNPDLPHMQVDWLL